MPSIEACHISKWYSTSTGPRHVLDRVNLTVERGEFVSIVGATGSGKTTLLGILAGVTRADAGEVIIHGEPVVDVRSDVAVVFQNYSLLPWFTAAENVRLAVEAAFPDSPRSEQEARARRALEQVGLGNALHKRPRQLSGGMRQRVALARAFAIDPQVLFLDEPFGALDALTRDLLQQELVHLCSAPERATTIVMITNSVEEAILLSDRIVPVLPGPPATLGPPIAVELPRPRTLARFAHDEHASEVRAHVIATLSAAVGHRRRTAGPTIARAGAIVVATGEQP